MKSIRWTCLAATLAWGMVGCASQSDIRILEDRVIALERWNLELQQKTAQDIDQEASALRNQSASLHAATDQVRGEIRTLNGKIEETRYQLAEQKQMDEALNRRMARIEETLNLPPMENAPAPSYSSDAGTASPPAVPAPAPVSTPPPAPAGPASENDLYNSAKQAFDRGEYQEARDGFQKLLMQHPNAKYADSAQFWIGETFYRQQEYEQAILEYQTVIEKYPSGNKVQAALLKQGFAFVGLGDKANARLILQELIEKYPNSGEAKIARQKLSAL